MIYLEFKKRLKNFIVFSIKDVLKAEPDFHKQRLSEWQKKGYIKKIIKEFYIFSDIEINESVLFIMANKIYKPSYISLEMALSYHNLIPESVYSVTSVTSRLTRNYNTSLGHFVYHKIKPGLMFGYRLVSYKNYNFKMAEAEKAILDFFYINSHLKSDGDFEELRINKDAFQEKFDIKKAKRYLLQFGNKSLEKRFDCFIKFIAHA